MEIILLWSCIYNISCSETYSAYEVNNRHTVQQAKKIEERVKKSIDSRYIPFVAGAISILKDRRAKVNITKQSTMLLTNEGVSISFQKTF